MRRITPCLATALLLSSAELAGGQSFSRVSTQTRFEAMEHVFVVADLNADGLDDIVVGSEIPHDPDCTPADRRRRVTLRIFTSDGDGTFTHAPRLTSRRIRAHAAVVVAGDFNGDRRNDLAVYDHGAYVDSQSSGYGNLPQLFLSRPNGVLRYSHNLAGAVRRQHRREPPFHPPAAPADLHLKMATTGDLDNDGDLDLWVESDGGNNMTSHFAVNDGRGRFTLDIRNRATDPVHHNSPPTWWRYHEALFLDVDRDGDSDLVLGQLRDPSRLDQFSIILVNDGAGYFPTRTELPHPRFNRGVTRVMGVARFDINRDGWDDILMLHVRNGILGGWTGRYIQALLNTGDGTFVDETPTWIRRQRGDPGAELRGAGDARRRPRRLPGPGRDRACGPHPAAVPARVPQQRQRAVLAGTPHGVSSRTGTSTSVGGRCPSTRTATGRSTSLFSELGPGRDGIWETRDDATWLVTLLNTTRPRRRPLCR